MKALHVVNHTRRTVLGSRIALADGLWTRMRGYLGRPRPEPGEGILLDPCDGVHMYGMTFPLDVVFLDAEGRVVHALEELRPGGRTERVPGARYVLEVPVGTLVRTGTSIGDRLTWECPDADDAVASAAAPAASSRVSEARRTS